MYCYIYSIKYVNVLLNMPNMYVHQQCTSLTTLMQRSDEVIIPFTCCVVEFFFGGVTPQTGMRTARL